MRGGVNRRVAAWGAAAALLAGFPASSEQGGSPEREGLHGWIPSLALTGGITFQKEQSSVESCTLGTELSCPGTGPLRPGDRDSEWAVSPYVGANLQLMTPALPVPGRPRFFVSGEILPTFASTRDTAKEGDPTGFSLPPAFVNPDGSFDPTQFPESAISGVGSRTSSEVQTLVWGANAGVSFPFQVGERQLRIKPSFGWLRYTVDVDGVVLAALKNDNPPIFGSTIREVVLSGRDSLTLDGIGPGLEVELDAARWGPIGASVYLDAHAYKVLGNRSVNFNDSLACPQCGDLDIGGLPPETYAAEWSFEVKPWMFRAGLGLRFHWLGSAR